MGSDQIPTRKLGQLCSKVGSGATPRGGSSVYLESGEISLIRSQNVLNNEFSDSGLVYIDEKAAEKLSNVIVEDGDVLLNITGDSVARCCQVNSSVLPARVNQHVAIIRPQRDRLNPSFLRYFLVSPQMQYYMLGMASAGATRNALTKGMIEDFDIPVPNIETQKAIAHILGSLDDKIGLNRRMNATLEAMAQALFKSWFVDFDPVIDNALAAGHPIPDPLQSRAEARSALGDQRKPLPKEIQQQFPNRFVFNEDMGWVPEGWDVSTIGDEIETTGGGTPSTKDATFWEDGIHAFCTPKDMSSLGSPVLMDTERHLTVAGVNKISSGQLPQGVVLMSSRAPIGYLAISDIPVSVNQGIIAMLPNIDFGSMYLLNWAHYNMPSIIDRANGSTFLEISKTNFRPIPFLVPNKQISHFFNLQAQGIYDKLLLNSEQLHKLATLRDTLLPKLLSGQLRIPEAEKQVAEVL